MRPSVSVPPVLVTLALGLGLAAAAGGALEKYEIRAQTLVFSPQSSPTTFLIPPGERGPGETGLGVVANGPSPVLVRFFDLTDVTTTVDVPQLSGFVWISRKFTEGPEPEQTGLSGNTDGQIVWGTVTGWNATGQNWCNAEPATICILAGDVDEATTPSQEASPFYDIGTWYFHGTGFTAFPFVYTRFTTGAPGGNQAVIYRGLAIPDGTVPALPLVGLAILGGAALVAGAVALGRGGAS